MAFLGILISNALLSALSITNLGLISSMVGFLLDQKRTLPNKTFSSPFAHPSLADHVIKYTVHWPNHTVQLRVLPEHLWTDQGHVSNGVAGYGFFLGLFGVLVAFRQRSRRAKVGVYMNLGGSLS